MGRSRMPVPSLLGLFGALLMLCPELLSDVPFPTMEQHAVAFAVEQYNQGRVDSPNYFKRLRFLKPVAPMDISNEYHINVELGKTACIKTPDRRMRYPTIQGCRLLPGNPEKLTCYFRVFQQLKLRLDYTYCT